MYAIFQGNVLIRMGRPPIHISKSVNLTLLGDTPARMKAVQEPDETRVAFIRTAISNEIDRRERAAKFAAMREQFKEEHAQEAARIGHLMTNPRDPED
jgi:hypothetical protein